MQEARQLSRNPWEEMSKGDRKGLGREGAECADEYYNAFNRASIEGRKRFPTKRESLPDLYFELQSVNAF